VQAGPQLNERDDPIVENLPSFARPELPQRHDGLIQYPEQLAFHALSPFKKATQDKRRRANFFFAMALCGSCKRLSAGG
jgi:hypothetical protein